MVSVPKDKWKSPKSAQDVFDVMLWANSIYLQDIKLEDWYPMLEFYHEENTNLRLKELFPDIQSPASVPDIQSPDSVPNPPTRRFKFINVDKPVSEFITENTSKNTLKANSTVEKLFQSFLVEAYPHLNPKLETLDIKLLPEITSRFFMSLTKEDGDPYNASTIQTYFQSLARLILDKKKVNIKLDPTFGEVTKVVSRIQKISCQKGEIPGKCKSDAIPPQVLAQCWVSGALGAQNPRFVDIL